jgi:hypothetical protein
MKLDEEHFYQKEISRWNIESTKVEKPLRLRFSKSTQYVVYCYGCFEEKKIDHLSDFSC